MTSGLLAFAERLRASFVDRGQSSVAACVANAAGELRRPFPLSFVTSEPARPHPEADFGAFALELFRLQLSHNPFYQRVCEARRASPETVRSWQDIPAIPAAAFKDFEVTCLPPERRARVFHSSGTTEQRPSRHFHCADSLEVYEASLWRWFAQQVLPDFESAFSNLSLALITPPPEQSPHSSLVHMFETVRRRCGAPKSAYLGVATGAGGWTLDFDAILASLREADRTHRPLVMLGTAFSFVHLVDCLASRKLHLTLPAGSRVMETGGYKGRSRSLPKTELHGLITERLGIPPSHIRCEYGMSELSSQAYDRESGSGCQPSGIPGSPATNASRRFHFPPWVRVRLIAPETGREVADGETGLIQVFDLANVWSVMAVQTEDLGIRRRDGFELIGRVAQAEPRGCSLQSA